MIFFQKGLSSIEREDSSVKCFPTFVRALPNGNERGKFLSLDLGGTNFRVIVMELTPDKEFIMDNKIYAIPQTIMTGMKISIKCVSKLYFLVTFGLF